MIPKPQPKARNPYTFRLRGHGQDVPVGQWVEESEQKAFKKAFTACKNFELPGWVLFCVETGTGQAVVEFIDTERQGGPAKERR